MPPPLQSAPRPTLTVAGQARDALSNSLVQLQVDDDIHGLKRLSATVLALGAAAAQRDEGWLWLDGQVLDFGAEIQVQLEGGASGRQTVFDGRISALELQLDQGRTPELQLLAEDRLMDLRLTRRFKTYEDVTDADIARQIAAEHGLIAAVDFDGPTWPMVQQWNQSDLAFLRERARRLAGEVWLDGRNLHLAAREQRDAGSVTLIQGATLRRVQLRADIGTQRRAQHVGGFDDEAEERIDEDADAAAVAAEAAGGRHGLAVLAAAFGEAAGQHTSHRVMDVPLQSEQARALARAALLQRARRFLTASGVADGNPGLQVGARLTLERVSPLFEGAGWRVTRSSHRFDGEHGYLTHFDAERPFIGNA